MSKKDKETEPTISLQVRERTVGYITAGLGLVASLAWNEAIKSLINVFYPTEPNSLSAKFLYATVMTLVVVVVGVYLARLTSIGTNSKK